MTKCTACHTGTYKDKPVLFSARRGDRLLVVEDVPALVCDVCGDQIFTEKASKGIERALEGEPAYSSPIYRFPKEVASPGGDG